MAAVDRIELGVNSSSSEDNSDYEIEAAFNKGDLTPGLYKPVSKPKIYVNNPVGLQQKLSQFSQGHLDWVQRLDVTCDEVASEEEGLDGEDVEDDFKREMHFYHQALSGTLAGLKKLKEEGVAASRPDDYFAEMVKTDEHMQKVRKQLLLKKERVEKSEKARKMREMKKFGKKIQQEVLEKRQKEKSKSLQAVKRLKKVNASKLDSLNDNDDSSFNVEVDNEVEKVPFSGKRQPQKSKKRLTKDKRFGFGGKKRGSKQNTAESSADMRSFHPAVNQPKGNKKRKVAKRPGKSRRAKQRQIRRKR